MGISIEGIKLRESNIIEVTVLYEKRIEVAVAMEVPHGLSTSPCWATVRYFKKIQRDGTSCCELCNFEVETRREDRDEVYSLIGEKVSELVKNNEIEF